MEWKKKIVVNAEIVYTGTYGRFDHMFDFLKKPKIEFLALYEGVDKAAPIVPANKLQPEWWKKLNINQNVPFVNNVAITGATVKRCMGVYDFINHGWVMPFWCDLHITVTKENIGWTPSDKQYLFDVHPREQMLDHLPNHAKEQYLFILKCHSPWYLKTSKGYSTLLVNPFYYFNEYFDVASGLIESENYFSTNTFLMIKKVGDFVIESGTPVCLFYPFKKEKINSFIVPYNENNQKIRTTLERILNVKFSRIKIYNKLRNMECPFHSMDKIKKL